ncbi:MAG: trypsin-like peptidase domain-containing protein [Abditibacteriaceae bacterium]
MNPTSRKPQYTSYLLVFLAGVVLTASLISLGFVFGQRSRPSATSQYGILGSYSDEGSDAIVRAVKMVGPAVVNVDISMPQLVTKNPASIPNFPPAPRDGKGTGIIFDSAKGLMLTNAHVVTDQQTGETAQEIRVTTRDGKQYTGKLLGADRYSDIAVVKLSSDHLPQAKLAHFDNVKDLAIGQWVIAIGNPYAQENTVTVGVISAVGRTIPVPIQNGGAQFSLSGMIQTDAAINPGNSGGPLCNLKGEVIGINTAIIPWATGLGFSIPINQAMKIARQIVAKGKVSHPYIGVLIMPVTAQLRQKYSLPNLTGALVHSVQGNSPAQRAGLMSDDVITKIGSQKIDDNKELTALVAQKNVGETIPLTVWRQGKLVQLKITIGDRPFSLKNGETP